MSRSWPLLTVLLTVAALPAVAQESPFGLVPGTEDVAYSPSVLSPEAFLGYRIGSRHTEPARVADYFEAVGDASARVVVDRHGTTHEGRALIHAVVTSEANHARLDRIREANLALSEVPETVAPGDLSAMPLIVTLGYSVHGNEASGTEAALLTLYHLAAGEGADVDALLDRMVVIVDPMLNPDGRDRFVDWVNRNRGETPTADVQDREHQEPWPGGRTNHYWYDLNRDWLPATQPESRARLQLFHEWRPQVVADFHEMGRNSTYFFQPGIPSRTHPNTPELNQEITRQIGGYHADALDRLGQMYFSEEVFDDFYYGKGSTYPDVNGSVGILFEQASSRALQSETTDGLLTYEETVRNQFATSLSTLRAAADLRVDLLSMQREFYASAGDFARDRNLGAYVLDLGRGRHRALELAAVLQRHRIELYEVASPTTVEGREFGPGEALIIPAEQRQARLIDAALGATITFTDSLFYDVSAWTLPYAFDVDVVSTRRADLPAGDPWTATPVESGGPPPSTALPAAFLVEWDGLRAARFLARLQERGVSSRLATRATTVRTASGEIAFGAGVLVIPGHQSDRDPEETRSVVFDAAREAEVEVHLAASALTAEGPDLGSGSVWTLEPPDAALLTGRGTSSTRTGETWEFLTSSLGLPVSLLDLDRLDGADLERYRVIVFAGGNAGDSALAVLDPWIRAGGRLVALGSAVDDVVDAGLLELSARPFDLDSLTADASWADRVTARGAHAVGGAILRTELDATHPLAFGIGTTLPTFRSASTFYDAESPADVVGRYAENPLLAGYVSDARLMLIPESVAVAATRMGRGAVIAILDEPVFRGFWLGSSRLLANAVFLGGGI